MTAPAPALIVSLPARSIGEAKEQIEQSRRSHADGAEIRIDRFPPGQRKRMRELFPSPLPLMATLRSRREGGEGSNDPTQRRLQLRRIGRLPFRWIDLEAERDVGDPKRPSSKPARSPIHVVSIHFSRSASLEKWRAAIRNELETTALLKIVGPATLTQLFDSVLPAIRDGSDGSFVVHTTGESGPLLRAWGRRLGLPLVFAALPDASLAGHSPTKVEPAQIPVDRLRFYFSAEGEAPLFAVLGHPIGHSLSPRIHSRWMQRLNDRGLYLALEPKSEKEFVDAVPRLAERGFRGFNVTHPFKELAVGLADRVSRAVESSGCANTLTVERDAVAAENTDVAAVLRRLGELKANGNWNGESLTVIGSGGSARATLAAASALGVSTNVIARSPERAGELARRFGATLADPRRGTAADLVVHCTPVGRAGVADLKVNLRPLLRPGAYLLDFVYRPAHPILRRLAAQQKIPYEDGLRLLVYQAAASYGIWWGRDPPSEEIEGTIAEAECTA